MKPKILKPKKCKYCKFEFQPKRPLESVCSQKCAIEYAKAKQRLKVEKEWKTEKKDLKERLKTHSDHLKELQVIFNKYIRLRDKDKPCISCGRALKGKYDAGHFYSVGSYPNLRFNENNVHGQCVHCNQHNHGAMIEYNLRLPERIGQYAYDELERTRNVPLKLTVPEILELKKLYKDKIKTLQSS